MDGTKYKQSVAAPVPTMLKEGRANRKLGGRVQVGPLAGARIWSLTLEERQTCPSSCAVWDICYGNHMPFAKRYDHRAPDFYQKLETSVRRVCELGKPVLLRLHVLGDFFSTDYVSFWHEQLEAWPLLHVYGYTAHRPDTPIGRALHGLALDFWWDRAAIRFSGFYGRFRGAVVSEREQEHTFTCPEQTGAVASCGACGACWMSENSVRFIPH